VNSVPGAGTAKASAGKLARAAMRMRNRVPVYSLPDQAEAEGVDIAGKIRP
jgi:hypothetical protein